MSNSDFGNGYDVSESYESFVEDLKKAGFKYLSEGSFRTAYQRGEVVIKVPVTSDGILDNMVEAKAWKTYGKQPTSMGVHLAPCRLLPNGCLMMVFVRKWNLLNKPGWAHLVDGQQVGTYKGRAVAYDYALDLTERFMWEKEWKKFSTFFNSEEWAKRRPHIQSYLRTTKKKSSRKVA
jgi:hypothetical protein